MSALRGMFAARYLGRAECEALARKALGDSTADETRVTITSGSRGNTRWAVNQISTAGDNYDAVMVVRAVIGRRSASATTNSFDDESIRRTVDTAARLAKLAPEDPEYMPEPGPQGGASESAGWSESTANLDAAGRVGMLRRVTDASRAGNLVATGYLESDAGATFVANNKGLAAYGRQSAASMTTTIRTPDGTGSGWAGAAANDVAHIDGGALAARAIEKARRSMNPVAIEPGRYTVVLEPTAVGNLVQLIAFALNARNADEGRSFFSLPGGKNKIGQKVVDERVSLVSDPADPDAPVVPFTADGIPTRRTAWIENGVVRNLAYDRYWAQKKGVEPTPLIPTIRLTGSGPTQTLDELIAGTQRGILVTRFWYIRPVDPRTILYTGLTRDGTFLIENGKVTHAVKNLRYNESPIFMLNNLDAVGRPERVSASEDGSPGFGVVMPPMRCRDFTFTSLSDAV